MRKLLFVFALVGVLSCSKDSVDEKNTNEKIVGKWHFESYTDGGLVTTTPASGCSLSDYITYMSDMTLKKESGYKSSDNTCKTSTSMQKYKIYENPGSIYLIHSYFNQPTDKLETEVKYKIIEMSENKLKIQEISIGHYKLYNGVSVYVVDENNGVNKIISTYSR